MEEESIVVEELEGVKLGEMFVGVVGGVVGDFVV